LGFSAHSLRIFTRLRATPSPLSPFLFSPLLPSPTLSLPGKVIPSQPSSSTLATSSISTTRKQNSRNHHHHVLQASDHLGPRGPSGPPPGHHGRGAALVDPVGGGSASSSQEGLQLHLWCRRVIYTLLYAQIPLVLASSRRVPDPKTPSLAFLEFISCPFLLFPTPTFPNSPPPRAHLSCFPNSPLPRALSSCPSNPPLQHNTNITTTRLAAGRKCPPTSPQARSPRPRRVSA